MKFLTLIFLAFKIAKTLSNECSWTPTTASGWKSPKQFCSKELIFEEDFDELYCDVWHHRVTLSGGRINE